MDTRETSRSRGIAAHVAVSHDERLSTEVTTEAPPEVSSEVPTDVHADLSAAPDVISLVPPPDAEAAAPPEVAGIEPPSAPAPSPREMLDEVKNLVEPDSAAAEMTGVIDASPPVPPVVIDPPRPRKRRRRLAPPRVHVPKVPKPKLRPVRIAERVHTFDSFRYGAYVLLWLATAFSSGGFWLQQVIVGWLAYDVTRSAFWTSLALGLDALPILFVGPLGGLLVDKFDKRKLMAGIYAYQAVVTSAFAAVVLTGSLQTWHIFAFIFLMGLSWVISDPARMSLIPSIVPRERLVNAFALNSMAFSVTRLAAPAIGGVLIAGAGAGYALAVEAALQLCAVAAVLPMRVAFANRAALRPKEVFSDLGAGARYVLNQPVILMLFGVTALPAILVMPSIQGLMPVYAAEVFGVDARGLGLLLSAVGAGSTLGAFALASAGNLRAKGVVVIASVLTVALATLAFSVNGLFQTAYLNLMVLSGATMVFFSVSGAVIQGTVSDEFRGRVSGLYMITWGLYPIGSLASGFLADRLGAPGATQIAGVILIAAFGFGAWKFRRLWREI